MSNSKRPFDNTSTNYYQGEEIDIDLGPNSDIQIIHENIHNNNNNIPPSKKLRFAQDRPVSGVSWVGVSPLPQLTKEEDDDDIIEIHPTNLNTKTNHKPLLSTFNSKISSPLAPQTVSGQSGPPIPSCTKTSGNANNMCSLNRSTPVLENDMDSIIIIDNFSPSLIAIEELKDKLKDVLHNRCFVSIVQLKSNLSALQEKLPQALPSAGKSSNNLFVLFAGSRSGKDESLLNHNSLGTRAISIDNIIHQISSVCADVVRKSMRLKILLSKHDVNAPYTAPCGNPSQKDSGIIPTVTMSKMDNLDSVINNITSLVSNLTNSENVAQQNVIEYFTSSSPKYI